MIKPKLLVVACMVYYTPKITLADFKYGTGCYKTEFAELAILCLEVCSELQIKSHLSSGDGLQSVSSITNEEYIPCLPCNSTRT